MYTFHHMYVSLKKKKRILKKLSNSSQRYTRNFVFGDKMHRDLQLTLRNTKRYKQTKPRD